MFFEKLVISLFNLIIILMARKYLGMIKSGLKIL